MAWYGVLLFLACAAVIAARCLLMIVCENEGKSQAVFALPSDLVLRDCSHNLCHIELFCLWCTYAVRMILVSLRSSSLSVLCLACHGEDSESTALPASAAVVP